MPRIVFIAILFLSGSALQAQDAGRTIPAQDARHEVLSSRTHYRMPVFSSREAWLERAALLRKLILA